MAVVISTVALLVVWLIFVFSTHNPDRWHAGQNQLCENGERS